LHFLFLESSLYHPRHKKRYAITKEIVSQNKVSHSSFVVPGSSELEQAFGALLFSSYTSFYLAMLNNLDPSSIPYVDYFKKQLAR
jgi:glucose/mannose-6-phosphate isomerase